MKKQKYFKIFISCFILLISGVIFSGCEWLQNLFSFRPAAPYISINKEEKNIYWDRINNAEQYEIYINQSLCETIDNSNDPVIYFNFSEYLLENGLYELNVCAISENTKSNLSNLVTYVYGDTKTEIESNLNIITSESLGVNNIVLNNSVLSWSPVNLASNYIVIVFNNEKGYVKYTLTETYADISDALSETTPSIIRVASMFPDKNDAYVTNNSVVYNFTYSGTYGEKGYLFDGEFNDYYITSESELLNVLYYNFISRKEEYNIRFSEEYANSIIDADTSNESNTIKIRKKVTEIVDNYISETSSYTYNQYYNDTKAYACVKNNNGGPYDYIVEIGFHGVKECSIDDENFSTSTVTQAEQIQSMLPYYETYDFSNDSRKSNTYFKSDHQFFQVSVNTSEELYWAVENGYTPICDKNSRAELIYNMAKKILNDIIGNDMSDFEKALSIYDYICSTTTYDKLKTSAPTFNQEYKITHVPSFYLEGVFIKKVAVCDGFSKAFSLLCNMEGLPCTRIVGQAVQLASKENHAWNKVMINGNWYIVDTTWAELSSSTSERLTHKYFLVTDEMTASSHIPNEYREKFKNYETSSTAFNYYSSHQLEMNNDSIDFFIDSTTELNKVMNFCLINNIEYIELFIERNFAIGQHSSNPNSQASNYAHYRFDSLNLEFQTLTLYYENADYYCQKTVSGCIVVVEIKTIISPTSSSITTSKLTKFINYLKKNKTTNEYYFYLDKTFLDNLYTSSTSYKDKIENLETNYVNINLEYIGAEITYSSYKTAYLVKITFS